MFCTLTTVVRLTTTLLTTRGPPQPAHDGRSTKRAEPHHGTSGAPQPSATQLTNGLPTTTRTPGAPKNATSAGVRVVVGSPFDSWVALGWGEPLVPWWGS